MWKFAWKLGYVRSRLSDYNIKFVDYNFYFINSMSKFSDFSLISDFFSYLDLWKAFSKFQL